MLKGRRHLFQERPAYCSKTMTFCMHRIKTAWLCGKRQQILTLPACSPNVTPTEHVYKLFLQKKTDRMSDCKYYST